VTVPAVQRRGEIWTVRLDPTLGHEQRKQRPAVLVCDPAFTRATGLALIVPLTSRDRGWLLHVGVPSSPRSGLRVTSFAMVEQLRSVDMAHRFVERIGQVEPDVLDEIDDVLNLVLGRDLR
jgi:mRNA interferase MazF